MTAPTIKTRRPVTSSRNRRRAHIRRLIAIQHLLKSQGVHLSLSTLRKIPKRRVIRYIQHHFTPEQVATYLSPHLVYRMKSTAGPAPTSSTSSSSSDANTADQAGKKKNYLSTVAVKDINEPISPTHEITTVFGEQINRNLFGFEDDFSFDPGLWDILPQNLPANYTIPDKKFIAVLQKAEMKYGSYYGYNPPIPVNQT